MTRLDDLLRIERALEASADLLSRSVPTTVRVERKAGGDPVTEADRAVDDLLRRILPGPGDGWLSEETDDDRKRLECRRVWVVDPLDGTRQFLAGIPEWCVSIALVLDGQAVAGGTCNVATGETFLGGLGRGVRENGRPVRVSDRRDLAGARVLASRSEHGRGEWDRFHGAPFDVEPKGSVAYKLSLVAAGRADATWSFVPKHEWDVAAGVALVLAAGGSVRVLGSVPLAFNRPAAAVPALLACTPGLAEPILRFLGAASAAV